MSIRKTVRARIGLALVGLGLLTACGTESKDVQTLLRSIPAVFSPNENPGPALVSSEQMVQMLSASSAPVQLFHAEDRNVQFMMQDIQRNGPYQSYASVTRQIMVLRDGMITSTRGLGGDLMSTEHRDLHALITSRRNGQVRYVQNLLTPEDVTQHLEYRCTVSRGGEAPVASGMVNSKGTVMTAKCSGAAGQFTDTYIVSRAGRVLSARQWLGKGLGYMGTQALRL